LKREPLEYKAGTDRELLYRAAVKTYFAESPQLQKLERPEKSTMRQDYVTLITFAAATDRK
jgi:hypothetical protein